MEKITENISLAVILMIVMFIGLIVFIGRILGFWKDDDYSSYEGEDWEYKKP